MGALNPGKKKIAREDAMRTAIDGRRLPLFLHQHHDTRSGVLKEAY